MANVTLPEEDLLLILASREYDLKDHIKSKVDNIYDNLEKELFKNTEYHNVYEWAFFKGFTKNIEI